MRDLVLNHESNLGIILVPLGVIGLIGTFAALLMFVRKQEGISTRLTVLLCAIFLVSTTLTALGSQVKIISSLSSGDADDVNH